jgi:hypothetical protein
MEKALLLSAFPYCIPSDTWTGLPTARPAVDVAGHHVVWACAALVGVDDLGGDWVYGVPCSTRDDAVHALASDLAGYHSAWDVRWAVLSCRYVALSMYDCVTFADVDVTGVVARLTDEIRDAYIVDGGVI